MAKMNWKSVEEIEIEKAEAERQALIDRIAQARKDNLINDTEMLAETMMFSIQDNMMMSEMLIQSVEETMMLSMELEALRIEMEEIKHGGTE